MRKPIQIAHAMSDERGYSIVALCDDGSIWEIDAQYRTWERTLDIPQDPDAVDKCETLTFHGINKQAAEINSALDSENERLNWKVEVARKALDLIKTHTDNDFIYETSRNALGQIG
jgi:hypothetical protein